MSTELENEIKESLTNEKIMSFFKKKKYLLFSITTLFFLLLILYQVKIYLTNDQNKKDFELYSQVISLDASKNLSKSNEILVKLMQSNNEKIIMLAFNNFFENNINEKNKIVKIIDDLLEQKKLSNFTSELLKIKKSLIIFDQASEIQMLKLLKLKNDYLNELRKKILYDFYISKNELIKANELKASINEK